MTQQPRLPPVARWLLRISPVPRDRRDNVLADLHELFAGRQHDRGALYAHWRLYHDVASLWVQRAWPVRLITPRTTLAFLRDAGGEPGGLTRAGRSPPRLPWQ